MQLFFTQLKRGIFPIFLLLTWLNTSPGFAQTSLRVTGAVIDASNGQPMFGVSVSQKGTTNGTTTDDKGHFVLNNVPEGAVIAISFVGYDPIELPAGNTPMAVQLNPSLNMLEDVVVIGYGSVKRKDVTTAISSVSMDDLNERPIVSAAQAIQGRAAGVSVIQPNGAPGGETSIRIRGTTSFNGSNDPLYVVDGVPVDNINFLSPQDIADMQILKDASSAAIYGSRAANGVVLITTKTGRPGEARIAVNAQVTQNQVANSITPLNTAQYTELMDEIGIVNLPDGLTDQTDWFEETYQPGRIQNYQVSISDGTEKLKYFLSGGYLDEKGVLDAAFYKRYNFRANIDNQVRKWLNVNANVTYSDYSSNGINTGNGANRGGVVLAVINTPTFAPIWDPENPGQYNTNFYGVNITSPLENLARSKDNQNRENRLIASGHALISFLPELTLKSSFTLDRRNAVNTSFLDPYTTSWGRNQYGEGSDNRNINTVTTWDNVANYNKSFGMHNLEVMAGSSWTQSYYSNSWINGSHYRNGSIPTLNAANRIAWDNTGSGGSDWAIMSFFGRVSYNFNSKYLLTANLRSDGSSKLHPDHRWGLFPSASAAWRLSAEPFLEDVTWLDDLKIRAGWGQTGNQSGVGDYAYLQRYNITRLPWFEEEYVNAVPTISPANLRTRDLTWETTTQTGVGIDFTALRNRLTVNLDYYYKKTTDMLMWVTLPPGQASGSIIRNEGEMSNRGFEIAVNSRNFIGDFSWDTDFNISFNRNRFDYVALTPFYWAAPTSDVISDQVVRNGPGRPLSGFYGYVADGVDPETGQLIYRDLNEDGKITPTDRSYIGDPNPDFTFGLTNTLSWKNVNLSVFLQGSYGNDIFNASRIETEGMYDGKNQSTRVLDRWRIPGQVTDVPKAGFDLRNSSYFVEDGSYLRVKNISLGYNVRSDALTRLGINRLQPYISATNLLTWTNYSGMDPEVNQWGNSGAVQGIDWGTYPQNRSFVVGINVEF
ncbi:SusC/RagA family TonB-linked outer membrane protein [Parapedobacter indicus]|uniref:TonB-linked outer membrane protein, SusC/RagA family n=1 Tax=Parapedobacter indicus TaxID=1477437 RepID=A0A1I3JZM5_9SPHI|nr:TonB-dependent receptor [Parapedobacter indicus]PPL01663.1 TonB-linked SusC/RagA family outer membrane protein [Parapedobacter indicus]SFI65614.1 TonB-linked outer membrane protein, SusC/RagA family [Parapedobacter indicus]